MMKLGAFELIKPIGEGGMGTVWLGKHRAADLDVAIKVMLPEVMDDPEYREAFKLEVRSVASLDHRNIVTILDFGQVPKNVADAAGDEIGPGSPYLVMEYAHGGAVDNYFYDIEWPDLRELLLLTLGALSHAHARDVIHRDLKPENILVGCGPQWDVKLTDFGLAHAADRFHDSDTVETAWGTPQYMAPEQLQGLWREYGPWTDLYGLGCMAFELICGKWPFDGDTPWDIGQAHIKAPIPPLEPRFEVPAGTEEWLRTMLAKQRRNRFTHAADAAFALAKLPSLDKKYSFGVLFEPQDSATPQMEKPGTEVVATQVMPELQSTKPTPGVDPVINDENAPVATNNLLNVPPLPSSWRSHRQATISNELLGISLGLFGLRAIPLVAREKERDRLWKTLHEVHETGEARQLIIEGAAGTGKSEILRWMSSRIREVGGARVLTAYHSPVLGPADGLVPMMERFLRCARLKQDKRREHLMRLLLQEGLASDFDLRAFLSLFERAADRDGDAPSGRQVDREQRYAIIYRYLSLIARRRPVLIWLDDIQWGLDALGFAHYVATRQKTDPAPILIAMTARTESLAERPAEKQALQALRNSSSVDSFELAPLEREDIETLVLQLLRLNEELAQHILVRSEGVPLFAVQLVSDWVARGKLVMKADGFALRDGANIAIPDDLHQLWDERLRGLLGEQSAEIVVYLELAAALGQEVETDEWERVVKQAGLPLIEGLVDRLVDEDLVRTMDGGWRFSHGMLQESLERGAREQRRWQPWNSCCAWALDELYEQGHSGLAERLAWHWIEANEPERALAPMGDAIDDAVARSDYGHAQGLIEWRAELDCAQNAEWRLRTDVDRARLAGRKGHYQECTEIAESVVPKAQQTGLPGLAAHAAIWAGVGRRALGDLDAAQSMLARARDYCAENNPRKLAQISLELGRVEEQRGDFDAARQHFNESRELFGDLDDLYGEAQAFNAFGDAMRQSGDFESAHQACLAALDRYKKLDNIAGIADCLNDLAEWRRLQGDLDSAQEFADEALRLYGAIGSGEEDFVRLNVAMIYLEKGEYDAASEIFLSLALRFKETGQQALTAQAKAGWLAANAGMAKWVLWEEGLRDIEHCFDATGVRAPMTTRALTMAIKIAEEAGMDDMALRAKNLVREQTQGIRHSAPIEERLE